MQRVPAVVWYGLAVMTALAVWLYAGSGRVAYTVDSLIYRDAAMNMLAGRPLMTTNMHEEMPEWLPLSKWPPGYTTLWAAFSYSLGLSIDEAPVIMNAALLAVTALLVFWIGLLLTNSTWISFMTVVAATVFPSQLASFGHAWSEALNLPLVLLAFAAFWKFREVQAGRSGLVWLAVAGFCVGAANLNRYTSIVYFPLLALGVATVARGRWPMKVGLSTLSVAIGLLVVAPFWLRNIQVTGHFAGSNRGGMPPNAWDRFLSDFEAVRDMLLHALFNFDMLLRAHFEPVLLILMAALMLQVWRGKLPMPKLTISPEVGWPLLWAAGTVALLLYARAFHRAVDMDYRMLAMAPPFLLLGLATPLTQALSKHSSRLAKLLAVLVWGLLVHTGIMEVQRVRDNYARAEAPRWRANFRYVYSDLSTSAPAPRDLQKTLGLVPEGSVVLTDYRPMFIRYLHNVRAFSFESVTQCENWVKRHDHGVLLTGYAKALAEVPVSRWVDDCIKANPNWQIIRASGVASFSLRL